MKLKNSRIYRKIFVKNHYCFVAFLALTIGLTVYFLSTIEINQYNSYSGAVICVESNASVIKADITEALVNLVIYKNRNENVYFTSCAYIHSGLLYAFLDETPVFQKNDNVTIEVLSRRIKLIESIVGAWIQ